ncbi:hypothetical protein [Micromonospora sp. NPDC005979]|uniref:hypothetical protein n=1 Tax=Micromonospora sp. NPDC005979 TaxID=3156726 RepID=UPI0033A70CF8
MTPDIQAVLAVGATTLVTAAATDVWNGLARPGFIRLFGRGRADQEAKAARRLDALAATVEQAPADKQVEVRAQQQPQWLTRLQDLVEDDPTVIDDLRALVTELTARLPAEQKVQIQNIVARDHGVAFGVQNGNIIYHEASPSTEA